VALAGTRYALALALLPAVPLALNADLLLTSWVGSAFAPAGPALAILVAAVALMAPQVVASGVLTYTGRHHATGKLALQAMLVNAIASLLLVQPLGLTGVASGTLIAVLVVDVGLAGRQLCRALGMSVGDYWRQAIVPALVPAVPAIAVGLGLRLLAPAGGFAALAVHAVVVAGTFLLTALLWTLEPSERSNLLDRLRPTTRVLPTGVAS
jgi:O-antigen/teichoic acid export membrane protein